MSTSTINENTCVQGAKNEIKIKGLDREMAETKEAIKEIRDTLLARPSWSVFFLLSGMSSVIIVLVTAILRSKL